MKVIVDSTPDLGVREENNQIDVFGFNPAFRADDGKTVLTIKIPEGPETVMSLLFYQSEGNAAIIDWGDGTEEITHEEEGNVSLNHTYTKAGYYKISITVLTGEIRLGDANAEGWSGSEDCGFSGSGFLGQYSSFYPSDGTEVYLRETASCALLRDIVIGRGVVGINAGAFAGCANLKHIIIPNHIDSIGEGAFCRTGIENIHFDNEFDNYSAALFAGCKSLRSINLKDGIDYIPCGLFLGCDSLNEIIIPPSVSAIHAYAFCDCNSLSKIILNDSLQNIKSNAFYGCNALQYVKFPAATTSIDYGAFYNCPAIFDFTQSTSIPVIGDVFEVSVVKEIRVPISLCEEWKKATNWVKYSDKITDGYEPQVCTSLSITADDVIGNKTYTYLYWTAVTNGIIRFDNSKVTGIELSGKERSEPFDANTSTTETVKRTISFTFMGVTATTEITQGVYLAQSYEVELKEQWRLSTDVANPDPATLDGVYESFSNHNVSNSVAEMTIRIIGYTEFGFYIRSNAESNYDYVIVSQLDTAINGDTGTSDTKLVKAHTKGKQNSGTTISAYQYVEFTDMDGAEHEINILYRKDSSQNSGTDRGYVLIIK